MKLTEAERLLLINQYTILKNQEPNDAKKRSKF